MELDLAGGNARSAYRAMISLIVPRPIAIVTTLGPAGNVNLAPFSYFNGVSSAPPIISISVGARRTGAKDTALNIERTGEFVVHVAVPELMDAVIIGAADHPPEVSELDLAKLTPVASTRIRTPGFAESPIRMECARYQTIPVEGGTRLILGRVLVAHVRDDL